MPEELDQWRRPGTQFDFWWIPAGPGKAITYRWPTERSLWGSAREQGVQWYLGPLLEEHRRQLTEMGVVLDAEAA